MTAAPTIFDKDLVRLRFARAAAANDAPDFLLRRAADDLAERLEIVRREFTHGICLGDYGGRLKARLSGLLNVGTLTVVDQPDALLRPSGDLDADLPAAQSQDLVVSALSLQLVNDLPGVMAQAFRVLKPDGLFLAALAGGETLKELRDSWLVAEEELSGGASPRVAPFADVRALGGLLQRAGFALPVADADTVVVTYPSPLHLMRDLKAMGMSNPLSERRRVPVTRTLLLRAAEVYAERHALADGRVPATFEIITLTGWVPHDSQPKPLRPGSATTSLADVLRPSRADRGAKE